MATDSPANLLESTQSERPRFERSEITDRALWILDGIEDPNADALDAVCPDCSTSLNWAQWLNSRDITRKTYCDRCHRLITLREHTEDLPRHRLQSVQQPGYFGQTWYHASRKEHWVDEVQEAEDGKLLVHAGSRVAALAMADSRRREISPLPSIYLHSFRFSSTASATTTVFEDMLDDWPKRIDQEITMEVCPVVGEPHSLEELSFSSGFRIAAYYNRYEVPGDISILFHAALIDLASVDTVELTAH